MLPPGRTSTSDASGPTRQGAMGQSGSSRTGAISEARAALRTMVEGAERAFAKYLASKHARAARQARNRDPDEIPVADVLTLYLTDIVPKHSRPNETQGRIAALGDAAPSGHRRNPQPDPASNPDACIISD